MGRPRTNTIALACWVLVAAARADFTFTRIADRTTPIPAGSGTFTGFAAPACDQGRVLFAATGVGQQGLYSYEAGELERLVDRQTPVPGMQKTFYEAIGPALDGGHYAFTGYYGGGRGVFSNLGGLHAVVTTGTTIQTPIGPRIVDEVGLPSVAGTGVVTFVASRSQADEYKAILRSGPGGTTIVADTAPGSPFTSVIQPALGTDFTAFLGYGALGGGVFCANGTDITPVVLSGDPVPGSTALFTSFTSLTARGDGLAFLGWSEDDLESRTGIYACRQGVLSTVADTDTPAPGIGLPFDDLINYGQPSIDGDNVAFAAGGPGFAGLYVRYEGRLLRVLDTRDTLDGKALRYLSVGRYGLSGRHLAFLALFDDLTSGIYVTQIPEPATLPVLVAFCGLALRRRCG